MTTPVAPPMSLSQVKAEFNGPNNLGAYLAGGGYVPPGASGTNGPVPSAPPMAMSKLLGTSSNLQQKAMTVGAGGTLHGYVSGSFGALAPNAAFFAGGSITNLWWNSANNDIEFLSDQDGIAQNVFTTLTINGTAFTSASATYTDLGPGVGTLWQWNAGNPFGSGSIPIVFT